MNKAKRHDHAQYTALPFKNGSEGRPRIMLLTSCKTRRWAIPKGWPMRGRTAREVAAREAFEGAGLAGTILGRDPIGSYHDEKQLTPRQ